MPESNAIWAKEPVRSWKITQSRSGLVRTEREYRYRVVDVFTEHPLQGNALAVFTDADPMDAHTMQGVARELNLAETAFVLPATRENCAARVRIFTPEKEMLFAGHPTIGTAFVLLEEGLISSTAKSFFLEELIGAVPVRIDSGQRPMFWLTTPPIESRRAVDATLCANVLGLRADDLLDVPPQLMSAGNPTIFVALCDKQSVDRAWLDLAGMRQLRGSDTELACVFVFAPTQEGAYSRMFAPEYGIPEDPATGSSTGPLAAYMMRHELVSSTSGTRFVSEQGTKMGRRSVLHVHVRGKAGVDGIEIGGHVAPLATATMRLPRT
jgi:trans-2,3-dihydro-3-hydroxyanthranilate isomerase